MNYIDRDAVRNASDFIVPISYILWYVIFRNLQLIIINRNLKEIKYYFIFYSKRLSFSRY